MSLEQRIDDWFGALLPCAFAGVQFSAKAGGVSGGWATISEQQAERGTTVVPIAPEQKTFRIDGYLTGPSALQRAGELERAFVAGIGTLTHPWYGNVQAIVTQYQLGYEAAALEYVTIEAEFAAAQLDVAEDAQSEQTVSDLRDALILESARFADELGVATQIESLRPELALEPPGQTGANYAQASTRALFEQQGGQLEEVPGAMQRLGRTLAAAEAGELTSASAQGMEDELLVLADRYDSLTLLSMRERLSLFLSIEGAGILAEVSAGRGETVQAIAVQTGDDLNVVAARNREAVARWFARGEVRR